MINPIKNLLHKFKQGNYKESNLKFDIKYKYSQEDRLRIIEEKSLVDENLIYNNPLPKNTVELCKIEGAFDKNSDLLQELNWYFDTILYYKDQINRYNELTPLIENSVLLNDPVECSDFLKKLQNETCVSYFGILTTIFMDELNESNIREDSYNHNSEFIDDIKSGNEITKFLVLIDFARWRMDLKTPAWQYDSSVTHLKDQNQGEDASMLNDYIEFKLNPRRYEKDLDELIYITSFDADFSVIDRYNSLKQILQIALFDTTISNRLKEDIVKRVKELSEVIPDTFWIKLLLLCGHEPKGDYFKGPLFIAYNYIEDLYFEGAHDLVIQSCIEQLKINANFSEIYVMFIKSLKYQGKELKNYLAEDNELYYLLDLISKVINKEKNYTQNLKKLWNKYYALSHFNFSATLLEFLYNEDKLNIPANVKRLAYLHSKSFRFSSCGLFKPYERFSQLAFLRHQPTKSLVYINAVMEDKLFIDSSNRFFSLRIKIGCYINLKKFDEAIEHIKLLYDLMLADGEEFAFIDTWINKTLLKCYIAKNDLVKTGEIVVNNFFKHGTTYSHFFDQAIIDQFNRTENDELNSHIEVPILFEIYNQPQSQIYDRLANFLASKFHEGILLPSQLIELPQSYSVEQLVYFFDKVCTKEYLQDCIWLNSIEQLEDERIQLLKYLMENNTAKKSEYNSEILHIIRESEARKGAEKIHRSRINVDTPKLTKVLRTELSETFNRYLELTDITYNISLSRLNAHYNPKQLSVVYYFKKELDENELLYLDRTKLEADLNAVMVPEIRYIYFEKLFDTIKQRFINDEAYGFKSFLSMRIRHGTFANVIRRPFESHNLISYRESDAKNYLELDYWGTLGLKDDVLEVVQKILQNFSFQVDLVVETGLSWIEVVDEQVDFGETVKMFNFKMSKDELKYRIYLNRLGRINNLDDFLEETYKILFEKLNMNMIFIRARIHDHLNKMLLKLLDDLQLSISEINMKRRIKSKIEEQIITCRTEVQRVVLYVESWFNLPEAEEDYVKSFDLDLILKTSQDYIDRIYPNSLGFAKVNILNNSSSKYKGKYFESFGDIFINLLDNVVSKNRSLEKDLVLDITMEEELETLVIKIRNNLSLNTNFRELQDKIVAINAKIVKYKMGNLSSSFEEGSGYVKICKSIAAGLERSSYSIIPYATPDFFEVKIEFQTQNLLIHEI